MLRTYMMPERGINCLLRGVQGMGLMSLCKHFSWVKTSNKDDVGCFNRGIFGHVNCVRGCEFD